MNLEHFGKPHESQRGYFAASLYEEMLKDPNIWLVCFDLGYKVFDKHFEKFPERVINTGASEQAGMGLAVGLALENKKVFTYTISSFYLRCAETISIYLAGEGIPVKMVGSGRNDDYKHDGASHNGKNAQDFIRSLGIDGYYPEEREAVQGILYDALSSNRPSFISLQK